jgi:hypothetical protein
MALSLSEYAPSCPIGVDDSDLVNLFANRLKVPFGSSGYPLGSWLWSSEALSREFLESNHNYIQWILPITKPSKFNPDAPVLNDQDVFAIRNDCPLQDNVFYSAALMLGFWGLSINFADPKRYICITPLQNALPFENLQRNPHNQLRMTRLVQSLRAFKMYHTSRIALLAINALLIGISIANKSDSSFTHKTGFANKYLLAEYEREDLRSESQRLGDSKFEADFLADLSSPSHPASEYILKVQKIWTQ